jgi:hypothetical protein
LSILGVLAVVWVLTVVQVDVLGVVVAVFVTVVGGNVAVATVCSRHEVGGQGVSRGAIGWFGSECRRTRGAGGRFEAGGRLVVVVVNVVGVVDAADGGCAAVVSSDVAMAREVSGCETG